MNEMHHERQGKGNINTPLELAMLNEASRFHLVIDVIDRVAKLRTKAARLKEEMRTRSSTICATRTSTVPIARSLRTGPGRTDDSGHIGLLFSVLNIIGEAGTDAAFPSQTLYMRGPPRVLSKVASPR
jgi:XFP C-terminal domain